MSKFCYLSVCSGIEAATVAWHPLGWKPVAFSEIEPFPNAVLKHHYPNVPNLGDMTQFKEWDIEPGSINLLVGGTPCQSFSVAGLREGMDDPRGNLALVYCQIAARFRPRWVLWENVPGVLSSGRGRDFGSIVGALAELGYGLAYRILDAQFFGVPQRRRRVFVVGYLGDWRRAAAVLFERPSMCWNPAKGGKAGEEVARSLRGRANASHREDSDNYIARTLNAGAQQRQDYETETLIAHSLRADGFDASEDGTGRGTPLVFNHQSGGDCRGLDLRGTAQLQKMQTPAVLQYGVRRITPTESERLQGFPDGYTDIPYRGKPSKDGPRYKALGNSMAVPVMRWVGERIYFVHNN